MNTPRETGSGANFAKMFCRLWPFTSPRIGLIMRPVNIPIWRDAPAPRPIKPDSERVQLIFAPDALDVLRHTFDKSVGVWTNTVGKVLRADRWGHLDRTNPNRSNA